MPITLNVQITLTDAQLSEIRGAAPVVVPPVVPPVVVPPVVVPTEVPVSPPVRTLHFGYYGSLAGQSAETVDHTSYEFAPGWDGSGLPLTRPTVLFAPSGESLLPALEKIRDQGGLHHIIALYPQDEPAENGLNDAQTIAKFEAARDAARSVGLNPPPPIMVCYGNQGRPGIENADIVGLDWYDHGPQRIELRRAGQKRFYVCGAANPWREDPVAYANSALADPDCWGVMVFIWLDQWGGTQNLGVHGNGMAGRAREAYSRLGWNATAPIVVPPVVTPSLYGWHADFRLQATTPAAKNFNWLMANFGANIAWNYLMVEWAALGDDFRMQADLEFGEGEANRIANHYSNQGKYAPEEYNDPGRKICSVKLGVFSYDMGRQKIPLPY